MKFCKQARCDGLAVTGKFCPKHIDQNYETDRIRRYDSNRSGDPVRAAYNSTRWVKFRKMVLSLNPICSRVATMGRM